MPARVICAVDDSSSSRKAASFAATFSRELGIPLELVHIVPGKASGHFAARSTRDAEERQFKEGARLLRELAERLRIPAKLGLHAGDPRKRLIEVATEEHAVILIVGSSSGSKRLGSVARHAVAKAPCPVIVVPSWRGFLQPNPVLTAVWAQ